MNIFLNEFTFANIAACCKDIRFSSFFFKQVLKITISSWNKCTLLHFKRIVGCQEYLGLVLYNSCRRLWNFTRVLSHSCKTVVMITDFLAFRAPTNPAQFSSLPPGAAPAPVPPTTAYNPALPQHTPQTLPSQDPAQQAASFYHHGMAPPSTQVAPQQPQPLL